MRLAWITDIHLECANQNRIDDLCDRVLKTNPDIVGITGDISIGPLVEVYLKILYEQIGKPIYFVLGNHDFWGSSFAQKTKDMKQLCQTNPHLVWLTKPKLVVKLTDTTYMVGHDGWYDGRYGDWWRSNVRMNDDFEISELKRLPRQLHLETLHHKGDAAAKDMASKMKEAVRLGAKKILVLTHIPPYEQLCWFAGVQSDANWTPHFACKAMGREIDEFVRQHPDVYVHILCGHSHGGRRHRFGPTLEGWCGNAYYSRPDLQETLTIE